MKPRALQSWVKNSATVAERTRRLAVWMAASGRYDAWEIAENLLVTRDAVGHWLREYNELGPAAFEDSVRGGRRHAKQSGQQEALLRRSAPTR